MVLEGEDSIGCASGATIETLRNHIHFMIKIGKSWKAKSRRQDRRQVRSAIIAGSDDDPERHRSVEHEPNFETDEIGSTKTEMNLGKHDQPRGWRLFLVSALGRCRQLAVTNGRANQRRPMRTRACPLKGDTTTN